jgi:predicted amidohydrolase YtcJ
MTTTLFHSGLVLRLPGGARGEWLLIEDGHVKSVGTGPAPSADRTHDLDGATLMPAFCDAHVHLPATGLYATGMDFRNETSADAIVGAFANRAAKGNEILFGGNFEDPLDRPLSRHELDAAVGAEPALLARADMHSCIVSTALLDRIDISGLEGVDRDADGKPTGYLREKAASEAWAWFDKNLGFERQSDAVRAAARLAYSKGVTCVHEMFVVEWRGWPSLENFLATIDDLALQVVTYVGTDDVERVVQLGLDRIGGDFFLDGSFGSHTAWMTEPYETEPPAGSPPNGIAYRKDEDLFDFFISAQRHGLQVGVHAIGDAAIEQAITTWEKVAAEVGPDRAAGLGHRIEHFECASDSHIERAVALGLRGSVQPAFDRFWGGEGGLYAQRIGWDRASKMNRFASMLNAGMLLGAGSDSTVTPLDPWLQVASLQTHHVNDEQLGRVESLRLHTLGARALAEGPGLAGTVEAGAPADFITVDRDPVAAATEELLDIEVIGTWIQGQQVWPDHEAEVS